MKAKVLIALPSYLGLWNDSMLVSIMQNLVGAKFSWGFSSACRVHIVKARDYMCKMARGYAQKRENGQVEWIKEGEGFTHIFMLDDDNPVEAGTINKLLAHDKDIVGVPIRRRGEKDIVCMYRNTKRDIQGSKLDGYKHYKVNELKPGLMKVDAIGFGAVLIKVSCLDKIYKKHLNPFQCIVRSTENKEGLSLFPLSEDLTFCLNATRLGFDIYSDTSISTGHMELPGVLTYKGIK